MVGTAVDTQTLLDEVARTRPDVVLLDFSLPGDLNGLEVCRRIKATMPEVHVVVFTANDDADLQRLAFEVGATRLRLEAEGLDRPAAHHPCRPRRPRRPAAPTSDVQPARPAAARPPRPATESGTRARTAVPPPTFDSITTSPPTSFSRSCMVTRPSP